MKTMSKNLGFSTKLILLAIPSLFNQAYAYSGQCGTLHLLVDKSIYQKHKISSDSPVMDPVMNHGTYVGCDKIDTDTTECTDFVFSQDAFQYGPDVDIEFRERNSSKTAKIRIQQNYCFFEGGNITIEPKNGVFNYRTYPGSYRDNKPGVIAITSIEAQ
ncbi:MAG: hypothetical protein LPH21_03010 [Shewanella sp.]|nr:hypothetical protein [Shewanella sp.]